MTRPTPPASTGKARQPDATEKQEQANIVTLLRTIGAHVYVLGTVRRRGDHPGTMQTPGIPDLYVLLPTKMFMPHLCVWIECKRRGGKMRPEQAEFREQCRIRNIAHIVGTYDDVAFWLTQEGFLQ